MASKTSPWVWVGIGCIVVIGLAVGGMLSVGYFVYSEVKQIEESTRDPDARAAAARDILGITAPPEGYNVVVAFSVPLLMDLAILSDREPGQDGRVEGFDQRGFIYVKVLAFDDKRRELEEFFEGKRDSSDVLREQGIRVRRGAVLGRGELEATPRERRLWVAHRGGVEAHGTRQDGITTMILVRCHEDDGRLRMGLWFGPDPDPEAAPEEAGLEGSVADPARMTAFLEPFRFCR